MGTGIDGLGSSSLTRGEVGAGVGNLQRMLAQTSSSSTAQTSGAARLGGSPTPAAGTGGDAQTRETARVKSLVLTEVSRNWRAYAQKYPEVFASATGRTAQKAPKVVFWPTHAAFVKAMGKRVTTDTTVALVDSKKPDVVNINVENLVKYNSLHGDNYTRAAVAHELIHNVTAAFNLRMYKDSDPLLETKMSADLNKEFSLDPANRPRQRTEFTVERMITEFSAEYFSAKATGIQPLNTSYAGIREVGLQTLKRVGEATWRKAIFENDTSAYRKVVSAALEVRQSYLPKSERSAADSKAAF
jgi:hypothetical protein